jgi:hypothetical protein
VGCHKSSASIGAINSPVAHSIARWCSGHAALRLSFQTHPRIVRCNVIHGRRRIVRRAVVYNNDFDSGDGLRQNGAQSFLHRRGAALCAGTMTETRGLLINLHAVIGVSDCLNLLLPLESRRRSQSEIPSPSPLSCLWRRKNWRAGTDRL